MKMPYIVKCSKDIYIFFFEVQCNAHVIRRRWPQGLSPSEAACSYEFCLGFSPSKSKWLHTVHVEMRRIMTFYCLTFAPINKHIHWPLSCLLPCHLVRLLHQFLAWLGMFPWFLQGWKLGPCSLLSKLFPLALSCRHCREKHWFPLHKCFFLVPKSEALHLLSCALMCTCVHEHPVASGRQ